MKRYGIRSCIVFAGALALAAALPAQDKTAQKPAAKPGAPDQAAMMEMMKKASTPGDMHKKLDDMVGTFNAELKMWMDPSKPPETSKGTETSAWALGGRFVETKFEGTFMGQPFNGLGYTGYDNVQKKYVGTWMDTAGTGMMFSTCTLDATGKSMTCKSSTVWDPMSGKQTPMEFKTTWTDRDHHTMEMFGAGPDGKNYKMMEISYTRKS
ncbi:MAG TPA: DUF1579 domain-containing protein [Thermoanaerobaculia bacterium]